MLYSARLLVQLGSARQKSVKGWVRFLKYKIRPLIHESWLRSSKDLPETLVIKPVKSEMRHYQECTCGYYHNSYYNIYIYIGIIGKSLDDLSHDSCIRDLILYFKNLTQPLTDFCAS